MANDIAVNRLNRTEDSVNYNGIDIVKFICAFLVCMIHIPVFCDGFPYGNILNFWLNQCLCRIAVPFYFTASGFLLFRKIDLYAVDADRVRKYCFKLLRLLGTWSFLLFVGGKDQLWYLGAVVLAVIVVSLLLYKGIKLKYIAVISIILFAIGLMGDSYYGFIEPLKSYFIPKIVIVGYDTVFETTRNGLFFGLIFVLMGALIAHGKLKINIRTAVIGFLFSTLFMVVEVFLLRTYSNPKAYNFFVSLLPATFFLFHFAYHIKLKDRSIYHTMRIMGALIFYLHPFVCSFVEISLKVLKNKLSIDLYGFRFWIVVIVVIGISVVIAKLAKIKRFNWLKYLYS